MPFLIMAKASSVSNKIIFTGEAETVPDIYDPNISKILTPDVSLVTCNYSLKILSDFEKVKSKCWKVPKMFEFYPFRKKRILQRGLWIINRMEPEPERRPEIHLKIAQEEDFVQLVDHSCSICLNQFRIGDEIAMTKCQHVFHVFCADRWLTQVVLSALSVSYV